MDLKAKYRASWALVTGGSSGIGKAITEKLAGQNINVVIVSLDDDLLKTSVTELKKRFPKVEFRAIGVDLSGSTGDYMKVWCRSTYLGDVLQWSETRIVFEIHDGEASCCG